MGDITLSLLVDQLGGGAGGGRFTSDFTRALLNDAGTMQHFKQVLLLRTQSEPMAKLGRLPPNATVVTRRFPSRLRGSSIDSLIRHVLRRVDVAHGLFYYVFPQQARRSMITLHDLSMYDAAYHPPAKRSHQIALLERQLARCDRIVVDTDTIRSEFQERWPQHADRCITIHPGVSLPGLEVTSRVATDGASRPYILTVGTIEPRKNYDRLLDSFEYLQSQWGDGAPDLVIVGRKGWMCDSTAWRLRALEQAGKLHWLQQASDDQLSLYYEGAGLFTYLSLYEGFGYPPFEAACAGCPMVLSNRSSVGEIWQDHACCVDPTNVPEIVNAWQWALSLEKDGRATVVEKQRKRAAEFSWRQCVQSYLELYEQLARESRRKGLK